MYVQSTSEIQTRSDFGQGAIARLKSTSNDQITPKSERKSFERSDFERKGKSKGKS